MIVEDRDGIILDAVVTAMEKIVAYTKDSLEDEDMARASAFLGEMLKTAQYTKNYVDSLAARQAQLLVFDDEYKEAVKSALDPVEGEVNTFEAPGQYM